MAYETSGFELYIIDITWLVSFRPKNILCFRLVQKLDRSGENILGCTKLGLLLVGKTHGLKIWWSIISN
ncbi:hypothetical protein PDY_29380 [Photobacterium damselae subsp. damselae]|nr:hypothetical protein PDY_29380 [Photobacterium damselae subsp. damselae]